MLQIPPILDASVICMSRRLDRSPRAAPTSLEREPCWTVKRRDGRDRGDAIAMSRLGGDDRFGDLFRDRRCVLRDGR
jgi:hypothetical protein